MITGACLSSSIKEWIIKREPRDFGGLVKWRIFQIAKKGVRTQNGLWNGVGEEKTVLCGGRGVCLIEGLVKTGKCVVINLQKLNNVGVLHWTAHSYNAAAADWWPGLSSSSDRLSFQLLLYRVPCAGRCDVEPTKWPSTSTVRAKHSTVYDSSNGPFAYSL